ncbi:hypothetical protein WJX77_004283 [Trebouxia sp. C0004]
MARVVTHSNSPAASGSANKKRKGDMTSFVLQGNQQRKLKKLFAQIFYENKVQGLVKRLAGNGNQEAVIDELMRFVSRGYDNLDWAQAARERW